MIHWFAGGAKVLKRCLFLLWTVRTVKGSVQVLRVYLQLSNLDFWVRLQNGRKDNNLWLTDKRDPVRTGHLAHTVFRFWCVPLSVLACRNWCLWCGFCQLTRWVHNAKYSVHPVWSVLPQLSEWLAESRVGFLSKFQQFLLWLCAIHWCKLI